MNAFLRKFSMVISCGWLAIVLCSASIASAIELPQKLQLTIESVSTCSASSSWTSYAGTAYYKVRYKVTLNGQWSSKVNVNLDLQYTFTGLTSNTGYTFQVIAYNSDGIELKKSKSTSTTLLCNAIISTTASPVNYYDATVNWSAVCNSSKYYLKYKEDAATKWDSVYVENQTNYSLSALKPSTKYDAEVKNYCSGTNQYVAGAIVSFTTRMPANIIIVLLDDARFQDYNVTGGPAFFETPNIDRIYNEGVSFNKYFVVSPLCSPSRSVMQCGLYNHRTGDFTNELPPDTAAFVLAPVLKSAGYHTALIGKSFNAYNGPLKGYDYWAGTTAVGAYTDPLFNINGVEQTVSGYFTHIVTDLALAYLDTVPSNAPFLLVLGQKAAHAPITAYSTNDGKYENETMPFPSNFYQFTNNYPSFLYKGGNQDSSKIVKKLKKYYETLYSIDSSMKEIFSKLEAMGRLDSTLILYTSDNGYLFGEHKLSGKEVVYEESIQVPLFARYPAWFSSASIVEDQFALNVDIVPTVFEAAHVTYNGLLDGVSIHHLFDHTASRNKFLFEIESDGLNDETPTSRGIRTMNYKYEYYTCSDTVKELFDIINDPQENNNLAYNPSYQIIRTQLQAQLDSIRTATLDTISGLTKDCYRANPLKQQQEVLMNDEMEIFPNPASDEVVITFPAAKDAGTLCIFNLLGNEILKEEIKLNETSRKISVSNFSNGIYLVTRNTNGKMMMKQLVVAK